MSTPWSHRNVKCVYCKKQVRHDRLKNHIDSKHPGQKYREERLEGCQDIKRFSKPSSSAGIKRREGDFPTEEPGSTSISIPPPVVGSATPDQQDPSEVTVLAAEPSGSGSKRQRVGQDCPTVEVGTSEPIAPPGVIEPPEH